MGLGWGLGSGLHHALRHDALSTSVSNNFVHIRRIGIRRNGVEPLQYIGIVYSGYCDSDNSQQQWRCDVMVMAADT